MILTQPVFTIYLSAFLGVNPRTMQDKIDKYRKRVKYLLWLSAVRSTAQNG